MTEEVDVNSLPPDASELPKAQDEIDPDVLDVLAETAGIDSKAETEKAKFRVKVDGTEREATLDDLISGYQKATAADERFENAARYKKQADSTIQQATELREQYQRRLEQFVPEQVARLNAIQTELNTLATDDPAQWVAKKQQFDGELQRLNYAQAENQRIQAERQQAKQQQDHETIAREAEALVKALPEWKDSAKAKAERSQIRDYLLKTGYDENLVDGISDHKAVILARKAMLYDTLMGKVASRKAKPAEDTGAPPPPTEVRSRSPAVKEFDRMNVDDWMKARNKQLRST